MATKDITKDVKQAILNDNAFEYYKSLMEQGLNKPSPLYQLLEQAKLLPIYTDRSRIQLGQDCPRARYWNFHHLGRGIVRKGGNLPLILGSHIHAGLAKILAEHNIEETFQELRTNLKTDLLLNQPADVNPENFVKEQLFMAEVLLRLWTKIRLPHYRNNYIVTMIEQEFEFLLPQSSAGREVIDMVRLDAVLRRKSDDANFILEFKTTSRFSPEWFAQWQENLQVILNIEALSYHLGERVDGLIIEGLDKGKYGPCLSKTSPWAGQMIQNSPLCYAYIDLNNKSGISPYYKPGWKHASVWTSYSPEDWAEVLLTTLKDGESFAEKLFATTGELCPPPGLRKEILDQTFLGENDYHDRYLKEGALLPPRNLSQCNKFGRPCSFKGVCFQQGPVEWTDDYTPRMPHHATEAEMQPEQPAASLGKVFAIQGKAFENPEYKKWKDSLLGVGNSPVYKEAKK